MTTPIDHLDALASALLHEDTCDVLEQLSHFLTYQQIYELALKCEVCPIHFCDDQICRDDEAHCYIVP